MINEAASSPPEQIKLSDLLNHGLNGNRHVLISEFRFGRDYVRTDPRPGADHPAWVAILPREDADDARVAVVKMRIIAGLDVGIMQSLQGVIANGASPLDSNSSNLLQAKYPRARLSEALIIEHARRPQPPSEVWSGVVLASLFIVPLLVWSDVQVSAPPLDASTCKRLQ